MILIILILRLDKGIMRRKIMGHLILRTQLNISILYIYTHTFSYVMGLIKKNKNGSENLNIRKFIHRIHQHNNRIQ